MKIQELKQLIKEVITSPDFGIQCVTTPESTKNKTLGTDSLSTIKDIFKTYKNKPASAIDDLVANSCQNLTNKQIAQAYVKLGKYNMMKDTYSVKQALKQINKNK